MFQPIPFYLSSSANVYTHQTFARKGDLLFVGNSPLAEYRHTAQLEWILDFATGEHVEDVIIRESTLLQFLNLQFNFKKWGYTFEQWKKCSQGNHLHGVLSVRLYGFLMDAWIVDAKIMGSRSIGHASKVTVESVVNKIDHLPRVEFDYEIEYMPLQSTNIQCNIKVESERCTFITTKPEKVPLEEITLRQFLINLAKQQRGARVYRSNAGIIFAH